jgi:hypothetical protein
MCLVEDRFSGTKTSSEGWQPTTALLGHTAIDVSLEAMSTLATSDKGIDRYLNRTMGCQIFYAAAGRMVSMTALSSRVRFWPVECTQVDHPAPCPSDG